MHKGDKGWLAGAKVARGSKQGSARVSLSRVKGTRLGSNFRKPAQLFEPRKRGMCSRVRRKYTRLINYGQRNFVAVCATRPRAALVASLPRGAFDVASFTYSRHGRARICIAPATAGRISKGDCSAGKPPPRSRFAPLSGGDILLSHLPANVENSIDSIVVPFSHQRTFF